MEGGKATFPCNSCEHVSHSKASMKKHSISHSADIQTCTDCDKQFATSKGLVLHNARTHKAAIGTEVLAKGSEADQKVFGVGSPLVKKENLKEEFDDHADDIESQSTAHEVEGSNKSTKTKLKKNLAKKPRKTPKNAKIIATASSITVFYKSEPVHHVVNGSLFDFWSDGEDDFKLMWLEEMSTTSRHPGCHCRACHPCTKPCCENIAVRSGKCCDPSTLGSCLQPFQAQCFAPCCHHSVQLRENFRWVGGNLVEGVEQVSLVNPLEKEIAKVNVLEQEKQVNEVFDEHVDEDFMDDQVFSKSPEDEYIPQAFNCCFINEYLDSKLGKAIPKANVEGEFFKFYTDSTLPHGCRIVHKKSAGSKKVEFFYRSSCGRFFNTRLELIAYVENREKAEKEELKNFNVFKQTPLSINHYKTTTDFEVKDENFQTQSAVPIAITMDVEVPFNKTRPYGIVDARMFQKTEIKQPKKVLKPGGVATNQKTINIKNKPSIISKSDKAHKKELGNKPQTQDQRYNTQKQDTNKNPHTQAQDQSNLSKLPAKPVGKVCRCEECNVTLSVTDITRHIVKIHPGEKMNRCVICKSGLMNINSFNEHKKKYHAEYKSSSDTKKIPDIMPLEKSTANKEKSRSSKMSSIIEQTIVKVKVQPVASGPCDDGITKQVSTVKNKTENVNTQLNTNTSDLNDSVETLYKIENFLNNSSASCEPKEKPKRSTSAQQILASVKSNVRQSMSTPASTKQKIKKLNDGLNLRVKRSRSSTNSVSRIPSSTGKRSRTSTSENVTDVPLKDTDPRHPTSSFNLRLKGRNHKGSKKLSVIGPLVLYNKYQLDDSTTINDCVDGEVLVFKCIRPETYYTISAEPPTTTEDDEQHDDIADNDERHPTNSSTLRRKGRDHKGKKELKPFPPLLNYTMDTVIENMIDMEDPGTGTMERFFKLSSSRTDMKI